MKIKFHAIFPLSMKIYGFVKERRKLLSIVCFLIAQVLQSKLQGVLSLPKTLMIYETDPIDSLEKRWNQRIR